MKDELKAIIEAAYKEARDVMQAHKGKWTANGKKANQAFRALEVACRKLGIPTPPISKRPDSTEQVFRYGEPQAQDTPTTQDTAGDYIANSKTEEAPQKDVLRPKSRRK